MTEKRQISWRQFVGKPERRDMTEGSMVAQLGTYSGLGFFVPTDFFAGCFAAMKAHDVLFDDDSVTRIVSTNGSPLPVPTADDTASVAAVVTESGSQNVVDINATNHKSLGAYSYASNRYVVSLESFDDVDDSVSIVNLFKRFSADQLARGIGSDLVNGSGINKPTGLIAQILAAGVTPVIAQGSSINTGGSETGATSLGTTDFAAAMKQIDEAYLHSDKCAWIMNRKTLVSVASIISKQGLQADLVHWEEDGDGIQAWIYGIPVKICPSMPSIGASNNTVILGDLSYWATRLVVGEDAGIRVYKEAPGLIENGKIGLKTFVRADGQMLWQGPNASQCPFVLIQQHS